MEYSYYKFPPHAQTQNLSQCLPKLDELNASVCRFALIKQTDPTFLECFSLNESSDKLKLTPVKFYTPGTLNLRGNRWLPNVT